MRKLEPNQPHALLASDLYVIGTTLISVQDIRQEQLALCLPMLTDAPLVFLAGGDIVIGKKADSTLCLAAAGVSSHHAVIKNRGGAWTIEDTGSRNGTWRCIQSWNSLSHLSREVTLQDGDVVTASECEYRFRLE
jgi:hypothetical protein